MSEPLSPLANANTGTALTPKTPIQEDSPVHVQHDDHHFQTSNDELDQESKPDDQQETEPSEASAAGAEEDAPTGGVSPDECRISRTIAAANRTIAAAAAVKEKLLSKIDEATIDKTRDVAHNIANKTSSASTALKKKMNSYANTVTKSEYFKANCKKVFDSVDMDKVWFRTLVRLSFRVSRI
jgi:hypothetical protein